MGLNQRLDDLVMLPLARFRACVSPVTQLVWNLAWVSVYVLLAVGLSWWTLRTNDLGERVLAIQEVQWRADGLWRDFARQAAPTATRPVDGQALKRALASQGLDGVLVTAPVGHQGTITPHLPAGLRALPTLYIARHGLRRIYLVQGLVAGALLLLLGLAGVLRALAAARNVRTILDERAIALAQSNFVSAVSHEMRTPLTTIQLYAEMLAQDLVTDPERRAHYLATISAESQRLGRLIENVLDYASISGRRKAYHFEAVDACELAREAIAAVAGPLASAGMEIELHAPIPAVTRVDRDALVQSLVNLLGNAIKYAASGRRVLVSVLPSGDGVSLSVADFGPGIPPAEHAQVFKPFYRMGNELTRTATGTGLGLALVAETARAHQGRVELDSEPGQGATFRLVLPAER